MKGSPLSCLWRRARPSAHTNGGPLEFSGQVTPGAIHAGEAVLLQEQSGLSGGAWSTIGRGVIGKSGSYKISHTFRQPGDFNLQAWFRGDKRNSQGWSDPVAVAINQAENPTFTIFVSAPSIVFGGSVSVSGTLYAPGSSTVPLPATKVTLWGHPAARAYAPLTSTVTGPDGSYSFAQLPSTNEVYQVRTTVVPPAQRNTSQVFEGVVDIVTLHASSTSPLVGETVTFTGAVSPDSTGHVISLEQLGTDANFHVVETGHVGPGSAYAFTWTLSAPGPVAFRALVGGGGSNVSAASPTVTVAASLPIVTTTSSPTGTTTTTTTTATVVTVTANTPTTFSFTLATPGQTPVASDSPVKLTVPAGKVIFNVTNPVSGILSHDFKVCSAPVTAAEAKKAVVALPSTCTGTSTPVLAPGSAMATLTLDLTTPGSYEYLSSVSGDALAGMKGILAVDIVRRRTCSELSSSIMPRWGCWLRTNTTRSGADAILSYSATVVRTSNVFVGARRGPGRGLGALRSPENCSRTSLWSGTSQKIASSRPNATALDCWAPPPMGQRRRWRLSQPLKSVCKITGEVGCQARHNVGVGRGS